jgi:hypothetical protein
MEQSCSPLKVEMVPGKHWISLRILSRERELSLALTQMGSFLNMEQSCDPLAVEIFLGKQESTAISAPILKESESSVWRMRRSAVS